MIGKILTHITKPNSSCDERSKLFSHSQHLLFQNDFRNVFLRKNDQSLLSFFHLISLLTQ